MIPSGNFKNQQDPTLQVQRCQRESFFFDKKAPGSPAHLETTRKEIPRVQPSRYTEAPAAMILGAWLLLKLIAQLGVIHMVLIFRHLECNTSRPSYTSTEISQKGLGDQAMCPQKSST